MSKKKKMTLFVSDIHMGAGEEWDWFDPGSEGKKLINFFDYVIQRQKDDDDIKEIVLLGDVFDLWVCPHDQEPHTFDQIIQKHTGVVEKIKEMAETVNTIYVNGNHDYQVTKEDINRAFGEKSSGEKNVKHIGSRYHRGNILAIHGHEYALFNRTDPKNGGPVLRLPLGYYITRLHTTLVWNDADKKRGDKANLIYQIIDESFQVMGAEKLPESVLDALKDAVEMKIKDDNTGEKYVVGDFEMGDICANQTYEDVRKRYSNLYEDWQQSVGFWQSIQMIMCELNRLGGIADQLCRDGVDIVVMGHSHDTKMDKDWIPKNQIYANCGFWCGFGEKDKKDDNAHFVQTNGEIVQLCSYKNGDFKKEKTLEL